MSRTSDTLAFISRELDKARQRRDADIRAANDAYLASIEGLRAKRDALVQSAESTFADMVAEIHRTNPLPQSQNKQTGHKGRGQPRHYR